MGRKQIVSEDDTRVMRAEVAPRWGKSLVPLGCPSCPPRVLAMRRTVGRDENRVPTECNDKSNICKVPCSGHYLQLSVVLLCESACTHPYACAHQNGRGCYIRIMHRARVVGFRMDAFADRASVRSAPVIAR